MFGAVWRWFVQTFVNNDTFWSWVYSTLIKGAYGWLPLLTWPELVAVGVSALIVGLLVAYAHEVNSLKARAEADAADVRRHILEAAAESRTLIVESTENADCKIAAIDAKVNTVMQQLAAFGEKIDALPTHLDELGARVDAVDSRLTQLDARIDVAASSVVEVETQRRNHEKSLKRQFADVMIEVRALAAAQTTSAQRERKGAHAMIASVRRIERIVRKIGPRATDSEIQAAGTDVMKLVSTAMSTYSGITIRGCLKSLAKAGSPTAETFVTRIAVWPPADGPKQFPVKMSESLNRVAQDPTNPFFASNATALRKHTEFDVGTLYVDAVLGAPDECVGFLWLSSEKVDAFGSDVVSAYAALISSLVAPLLVMWHGIDEQVPTPMMAKAAVNSRPRPR